MLDNMDVKCFLELVQQFSHGLVASPCSLSGMLERGKEKEKLKPGESRGVRQGGGDEVEGEGEWVWRTREDQEGERKRRK